MFHKFPGNWLLILWDLQSMLWKSLVYMVIVLNISYHHFVPHPLHIVHKLTHQAVEK